MDVQAGASVRRFPGSAARRRGREPRLKVVSTEPVASQPDEFVVKTVRAATAVCDKVRALSPRLRYRPPALPIAIRRALQEWPFTGFALEAVLWSVGSSTTFFAKVFAGPRRAPGSPFELEQGG